MKRSLKVPFKPLQLIVLLLWNFKDISYFVLKLNLKDLRKSLTSEHLTVDQILCSLCIREFFFTHHFTSKMLGKMAAWRQRAR